MKKLKIIKGSNYEQATEAIKMNGKNQCPCVPSYARTADTKCVCTEFRQQQHEGECHCRRFAKVLVEE